MRKGRTVLGQSFGRLPLLLLLFVLLAVGSRGAQASHPFQGSGNPAPYNINYLYRNLEPGGSGSITYSVCRTTAHPSPADQWDDGVERWDTAIARWQFNPIDCNLNAHTKLTWETSGDECTFWACWKEGENTPAHGSHRDIGFSQFAPTTIFFDYGGWNIFDYIY